MNRFRQLGHETRGQALVEMALVMPILILLLLGLFELGRIFGTYLEVTNLARDAARYGVVGRSDADIEQTVKSECASLDADKLLVAVSPEFAERIPGSSLEVEVDYSLSLFTPLISNLLPNPFPLTARCFMRMEQ